MCKKTIGIVKLSQLRSDVVKRLHCSAVGSDKGGRRNAVAAKALYSPTTTTRIFLSFVS